MISDYCDGGLKVIDIFAFNKSVTSTWMKKSIAGSREQKKMEIYFGFKGALSPGF